MENKLPVNRVVSVSVNMSPKAAALRNFGNMLIVGDSDVITPTERIRDYGSSEEVAQDFGVTSNEYLACQAYFSQTPQPSTVSIGRYISAPTPAAARGAILNKDQQSIDLFTSVTAGTLKVKINGSDVEMTGIDFSECLNMSAVASVITTKLDSYGDCVFVNNRFIIRTATTGTTATISGIIGTVSALMGLNTATYIAGYASETLASAISLMLEYNSWYGLFVACDHNESEDLAIAGIIEAASTSHIYAITSQDSAELDADLTSSIGYKMKSLGYKRTFVMYSSYSKYAAASILGRMATVNFQGSNTCITLKFKQCPSVVAESIRTSQANALSKNNVNVFANYSNDTAILQEGTVANGYFIDEVHGLDWLQNQVETDLWNLLYTSTTKVGQDERGMTTIVATVTKSLVQAVTNGLVSAGVWNGGDIGSLKSGDTLSSGFYVYIQPIDEQSQADREARKAPPVQIAVKLRGAVHFIDAEITVNR